MLWLAYAACAGAGRSAARRGEFAGIGANGRRFYSPPLPQEAEDGIVGLEAVAGVDFGGRHVAADGESPERLGGVHREGRQEKELPQGSLPQLQRRLRVRSFDADDDTNIFSDAIYVLKCRVEFITANVYIIIILAS
ncbi:unnamed protein product [Sphenostylis stenocarpa]|uniref:Uncharacterized protein n=1 Tax=Sphenostylis stenocarpa TaxID=92480 RepID=A0AA86W4U7_9FABA|nr:unnamed protein product [Sphenostylis stenocarpa]